MNKLTVAAVQMRCDRPQAANLDRVEILVRQAAMASATLILLPELFEYSYFCKDQNADWFAQAVPLAGHPTVTRMQSLAAELRVVLVVSVFERANTAFFNSLVVIEGNGTVIGVYRKAHIPTGHGYQEKFYFSQGDSGFQVFPTSVGRIGCGICWDQWFPEMARILVLKGAEILLYPTAIGSEPQAPNLDSRDHWMRVMQGHAAANLVPVVAANRIGREQGQSCSVTFYGSSFIAGPTGEILALAERDQEAVISADVDLDEIRAKRTSWGVFRDRRPDLYSPLLTLDGDGVSGSYGRGPLK